MKVDQQLTLLRLAARVDPRLRQAVSDIEAELERLRAVAEAARTPCDCNYVSGHWADCDLKQALAAWEAVQDA